MHNVLSAGRSGHFSKRPPGNTNSPFPPLFYVSVLNCSVLSTSCCCSCRVPLLIAHPQSPFKGQHYSPPVESVDVYATINELLRLPVKRESVCGTQPNNWVCRPLDGKSLAPVILGVPAPAAGSDAASNGAEAGKQAAREGTAKDMTGRRLAGKGAAGGKSSLRRAAPDRFPTVGAPTASANTAPAGLLTTVPEGPVVMPKFAHDFAISQVIRCAPLDRIPNRATAPHRQIHTAESKGLQADGGHAQRQVMWNDCETRKHNDKEMSLLGYSMRTLEYRYTAYYPFDRKIQRPIVSLNAANGSATIPYEEELFDHKNETLSDFTHRETINLAYRPGYAVVVAHFRTKLAEFVLKAFSNVSPHKRM